MALQVSNYTPSISTELEDLHLLPINCIYDTSCCIIHCRHLEQEHLLIGLMICWPHFPPYWVKDMGIFHVPALEATEYQNFILVHLSDTGTLSCWEFICRKADQFPVTFCLIVILLYWIAIFLGLISYSTEDIDKSVFKRAASVIVPTFIKLRKIKP